MIPSPKIVCDGCEAEMDYPHTAFDDLSTSAEQIAYEARHAAGWLTNRDQDIDLCPDCLERVHVGLSERTRP